ncbi:unnamed protein product [Closterium sp. NIES-54]
MAAAKMVLRYLCSTSGMGLVLGGRRPVVLTGHADTSWADDQATQRSSQGYTFSLGSGSVSWRSTRSSSVLSSSCEAEIYAGAMAAQELRWLTYLLTDLGEQPRSPPILYVDNKAMLALCREHRLEHRTKHIALRYFLARELQQRGQLRLAYVASEANTADIFTKALAPGDHQRFCTLLGEQPRSPPVLYVDNKAMLALCREHRLEHRTKHIALRYFLGRELQQRGQLRLAYVASEANTADIFTKALAPGDHQRFCTLLDCVVFLLVPNSFASSFIPISSHVAQVATAAPAAPVAPHAPDAEHTPAHVAGPSRQRQRRRTATSSDATIPAIFPPLPSTTNTTWSAATFNDEHVRAKAEILEDMRAYLKHAEYKLQHGDLAGGLEMVVAALDDISARFDMFQVEDAADDRVAKRYKMYLQKSLLTSRPFKQAVADVAAMDRAAGAHARSHRGGNHGAMAFAPKRGPPTSGNFQGFRGSCFRCGQPGHVANACPRNGHGGQRPAPVV